MDTIAKALRRGLASPGFKFFLICALILALAIPLFLVWALIEEREQRADSVQREIAQEWSAVTFVNALPAPSRLSRAIVAEPEEFNAHRISSRIRPLGIPCRLLWVAYR